MFRPYQLDSLDQISTHYRQGTRRVVLWLATGAGKTHIFCEVIKRTLANDKKVLLVVKGRKLIDQASVRLWAEDVAHGVIMSGHWNVNKLARCQVCSIDTLTARSEYPEADLVVVDEADQAVSPSYRKFLARYQDKYILGVTATPYTKDSLRHVGDAIVHPITFSELVKQGYLVAPRFFAPSTPNLDGVKTVTTREGRDYDTHQLAERMSTLTGDLPEHWFKLAKGRPTLLSAVNIPHSQQITAAFNACGIRTVHLDASSTDEKRKEIILKLEKKEIDCISQVGIANRGTDIPCLGAVIMARPTQSYNFYLQLLGRGTRTFPGKKDFLVLDHAGNYFRHGPPQAEPEPDLDGLRKKRKESHVNRARSCPECFAIYEGPRCHECNHRVEGVPLEVQVKNGWLTEIEMANIDPLELALIHLKLRGRAANKSEEWAYREFLKTYGPSRAAPYLPAEIKPAANKTFAVSPYRSIMGKTRGR